MVKQKKKKENEVVKKKRKKKMVKILKHRMWCNMHCIPRKWKENVNSQKNEMKCINGKREPFYITKKRVSMSSLQQIKVEP